MISLDEMFVFGLRFDEMIWIFTYPHDRLVRPTDGDVVSMCAWGGDGM